MISSQRLIITLLLSFLFLNSSADSKEKQDSLQIKTELSLSEKINQKFEPLVGKMYAVLFWDPFSALGLYDPVVYDEQGLPILDKDGKPIEKHIPFIVVWLILGAVYFTFRMKFVNIRAFRHAIDLVKGKFDKPEDEGEVSHFQALATALSGTVGLGNIAGVALAITVGGPGATFWMIVAGLFGMSAKFVEVTLGVKYRKIFDSGEVAGGPMYYLSRGLKAKNLGKFGAVLAFIYAVLVIGASFGGGNMFQANQAYLQFSSIFKGLEGNGAWFGLGVAILVGTVVIGGIKNIAKVTEKIVPIMAALYVLAALVIIGININELPKVLLLIFDGAFSPEAVKGGIIGVLVLGFQRAAFSNEAGIGSASIAHSAVKTDEPISEGLVALLEPLIDTVVICTLTALVIIFTGFHQPEIANGLDGAQLTSKAFGSIFSWFPYLLSVAIMLFAFSTMISWSYYGLKGFNYLFRTKLRNLTGSDNVSKYIFFTIFLSFTIIGASSSMNSVIDFSDMMILTMAFPNIIGLLIMTPEVARDLKSYLRRVKTGEIKKYK